MKQVWLAQDETDSTSTRVFSTREKAEKWVKGLPEDVQDDFYIDCFDVDLS